MARFSDEMLSRAQELVSLYPDPRSATIPLCHLAQEQDGYVTNEAMEHIGELVGSSAAEVQGTASFYDMLKLEPVGRYVVGVCTNIACMLRGAYEVLEDAEEVLGVPVGGTTEDGLFTLEEVECIAHCDRAPAAQVNYRYFGPLDRESLQDLVATLRNGDLDHEVPPHGTLIRVRREAPPVVPMEEIDRERAEEGQ
ncbi:MAG: NAD(P)H-dependent oxidoreductase subunit E [Ferrimicrobium sp.]|nr:NAD(P)H-dependent oxidoreductase subunit E [Ferrimicrobium sp.]